MRIFVTGGAGFIGSHFCDSALKRGHEVLAFDNFSTGQRFFLEEAAKSSRFSLVQGDIRNLDQTAQTLKDFCPEWVVHLAANADVRKGTEQPRKDLEYNTLGTWNILESCRQAQCKKVFFSSTGSVYGEPSVFPTPENAPYPIQTSLYGASKSAGEALISAYCFGFEMTGLVYRFVSILGPRYTHGHVFDFVSQLRSHPEKLKILGDGKQTKSYLHVEDLMEGIWLGIQRHQEQRLGFEVFNIGHDEVLEVNQSISMITEKMGLNPERSYSGGERGWIGDSPRIHLDTQKLKALGWSPKHSLRSAVHSTVDYLMINSFLLSQESQGL